MAIHDPIRQRLISASQRPVGFLRSIFRRSRKGRAMGDRTRNRGRSQNGESLVSFALTFPVLFGFLFGIMQVSMAYYTYQWMSETAREGARYAIVHGSTCETSGGASCTSTASAVNSYVSGTGLPNIGGGASTIYRNHHISRRRRGSWTQGTGQPNLCLPVQDSVHGFQEPIADKPVGDVHRSVVAAQLWRLLPGIFQQPKPQKTFGGGHDGFLIRTGNPAQDAPGLFVAGILHLTQLRQDLFHCGIEE